MAEKKTADSGEAEVQAKVDAAEEQGFLGDRGRRDAPARTTPCSGVLAGKPTPENRQVAPDGRRPACCSR
jgi:hypothetical protein